MVDYWVSPMVVAKVEWMAETMVHWKVGKLVVVLDIQWVAMWVGCWVD